MSNNANEPTIEQIKQSLDIITVAEMYGELVKNGANYKFKNDTSIVVNPSKQIFSNFNGDIAGGSVLDLVMYFEKLDTKAGIERLKELSTLDTYTVDPALQIRRKEEAKAKKVVDFQKLQEWGIQELQAVGIHRPIECEDTNNKLLHFIIPTELQKLFETKTLHAEYKKKIDYIFKNLIGWNKHFNCSSIVLKDDGGRIVDLIAYRPNKPQNYKEWSNPKYIYKNSHDRGNNFLYPFRKEVETILAKQSNTDKYLIVGEGIKNGLNALIYSAPYLSIESTSNNVNENLIAYIRDLHEKGFSIVCMFDGDTAGARAYLNFIKSFDFSLVSTINNFLKSKKPKEFKASDYINFINSNNLPFKNFLAFDSNTDFVEDLQSGGKL